MADMNQTAQSTPTGLTCPKCAGAMRSYERNGITIDQCNECRGIFLDRGELERLIEAEDVHYGQTAAPRPAPDDRYAEPGYADPRFGGGKHGGYGKHGGGGKQQGGYSEDPRRRRRGGFLGDLLDFG